MDGGGSARRFSPASGVLSSRAGYDLGKRVQRKGKVQAVLTEGSRRSDLQRRGPATSTGDGDGAAFAEGSATGLLRNLEWHG